MERRRYIVFNVKGFSSIYNDFAGEDIPFRLMLERASGGTEVVNLNLHSKLDMMFYQTLLSYCYGSPSFSNPNNLLGPKYLRAGISLDDSGLIGFDMSDNIVPDNDVYDDN
ncbi:hypothetical protein ACRGNN_003319 [Providencia stuartii]|uniref:hypothetical protein n=1 Tax=Providencia stuartii TaxID=588 RepID=UPI0018C57974|nr:hypothetical protein [Providencia stuartii]EMD1718771.1 hypothetical protein [Providencia stuartii]MBG5908528.1 hypothetical protein [Providencia stuartii]WAZ73464.1 hypothetical protein O4Z98_12500 [Providencia stuartii]HAU5735785.1 hypothetical protein [Providencia stuartii]HAU5776213.1 hypothetical protein [Providencia stuartii]